MANTAKNKADLVDENKQLKDMVKDLGRQLKEIKEKEQLVQAQGSDNLDSPAISLTKEKDGTYKIVELKYNAITGEAKVTSIKPASHIPKDNAMALYELKRYVAEIILPFAEKL